MALKMNKRNNTSIAVVCEVFSISASTYYYKPKLSDENVMIANYLLRLTQTHKRWGFKLCYLYLRNVKGYKFNHKRVYRIYHELALNLRIKPKSRIKRNKPEALLCAKQNKSNLVNGLHVRFTHRWQSHQSF